MNDSDFPQTRSTPKTRKIPERGIDGGAKWCKIDTEQEVIYLNPRFSIDLFPNLKIEKIAKIGKLVFWTLFGKKEAGCERSKCLDGVREKVYSTFA